MTTYLLDTFTGGAGDLTGHTSDSGATWTNYSGDPILLDGSGTVANQYVRSAVTLYKPSMQVTASTFAVEIDFDWANGSSFWDMDARVGVALFGDINGLGDIRYSDFFLSPSLDYDSSGATMYGEYWTYAPYNPPTQPSPWPLIATEAVGAHTLRLVFRDGLLISGGLDGVEAMGESCGWYSSFWADNPPSADSRWGGINFGIWPGLYLRSGGTGSLLKVSRFEVMSIPAPVTNFWTDFVLTKETLT